MSGLMVHCGGRKVGLEEVKSCSTPNRTSTHVPIPHSLILELVEDSFNKSGYEITSSEFALRDGKDSSGNPLVGSQMFGLLNLRNGHEYGDYGLVAGIRNSHDKSMSAGICLGSKVFVCDNMAFSGEVKFARKHTRNILDELPSLVYNKMRDLKVVRNVQERRIEAYKGRSLDTKSAYTAIIEAFKRGIISSGKIGKVVEEWDIHDEISCSRRGVEFEPRHVEFAPRNAWSLFNCFTEVMKSYIVQEIPQRTMALHELMDAGCGLNFDMKKLLGN